VLDVFEEEQVLAQAERLGQRLQDTFSELQRAVPAIGDVRGLGAMMALEFVRDPASKEPAPELVDEIIVEARKQGLLLLKAGLYGNVLRILAPLNIEEPLIEHALDTLCQVIKQTTGNV